MEVKLKEPITGELLHALHDAEIFSIDVDRLAGSLRIGFVQTSGAKSWLEFLGVVSFRLSDFVVQNVVCRVRATPWHTFEDGRLGELIVWSNSFSDATIRPSSESLERTLRAIKEGRLTVAVIEPSRGAEAVVVAEGVFLESAKQLPVM
ncbi:hypothetical protein NA29_02000 [Pandoraea sputorum]|nr:hypothetical protein NA29_02000 [Pandoraea sputorum]